MAQRHSLLQPWRALSLPLRPAGIAGFVTLAYTLHARPPSPAPGTHHAPLIILHGLFGSKQNNKSISKALARDLQTDVYAVDLRNHGDSPHDTVHTYEQMAGDLFLFMKTHGLRSPTIIGHSMGGKVAMLVALRSSAERWSIGAMISVDNAPVHLRLNDDLKKYIQGMKAIQEAKIKKLADADRILADFEESVPIRQFLLTNLTRHPGVDHLDFRIPVVSLGAALDAMGDFPVEELQLSGYQGPSLFVRGAKSRYVPDSVLPIIRQLFPQFELQEINSGHWVISEQPEAFKRVVLEFLARRRV